MAWKLAVILVEQDGIFVAYRMIAARPGEPPPGGDPKATVPMKRIEVARAATRREVLAKVSAR